MQYKRAKDGHAVYRVALIHALVHEDIMVLSKLSAQFTEDTHVSGYQR